MKKKVLFNAKKRIVDGGSLVEEASRRWRAIFQHGGE